MNLKDIAFSLHVSPASVSIVRNGQPGVSAATRRRIQIALEENGYTYEPFTQSSFLNRTVQRGGRYIQLLKFSHSALLTDKNEGVVDSLISALDTRIRAGGYNLVLSDIQAREYPHFLGRMHNDRASALVVVATEMTREDILHLTALDKAIVLVDCDLPDLPFSTVSMDNRSIGVSAVNSFRNCKNIGYLRSCIRTGNFDSRESGFREGLRLAGIPFSEKNVFAMTPSLDRSTEEMNGFLEAGREIPEALFADNDVIAVGAMRALIRHGYRIPDDVQLIGVDNTLLSGIAEPPLTTMQISRESMSMFAFRLLMDQMENGLTQPVHIHIGCRLVSRGSTKGGPK